MQLRYKKNATLKLASNEKQANGVKIETYNTVKDYIIQIQELTDEISASIYGADVNSMIRISSIKGELEAYLKSKVGNQTDNVSKYYIYIDGRKYKIKSVRTKFIDIQDTGLID